MASLPRVAILVLLAIAACGGGTRPVKQEPAPANTAAPAADPIEAACEDLTTRCPGTEVAACREALARPNGHDNECQGEAALASYTSCASGCLPSVVCADDPALNCAVGCEQTECTAPVE